VKNEYFFDLSKIEKKEVDPNDYDLTLDEIQIFQGHAEVTKNNMISQNEYLKVVQMFEDKLPKQEKVFNYRKTNSV
jgi:hypothetical protein